MSNTNIVFFLQDAIKGMKSYGARSLIEIDHTNIITGNISLVRGFFRKAPITLISNFDPHKIKTKAYKNINYIWDKDFKSTLLKLSKESNHLVFFNNDVVFNDYLVHTIPKDRSALVFDNRPVDRIELCGLVQNGKVVRLAYGLDEKNAHTFSHIYVFHKNELARLGEILVNPKFAKFSLYEIVNLLIDDGYSFDVAIQKKSKALVVTHPSDITKVGRLYK